MEPSQIVDDIKRPTSCTALDRSDVRGIWKWGIIGKGLGRPEVALGFLGRVSEPLPSS